MAVRKKSVNKESINSISTFITEDGLTSRYFNITDIPSELPLGKSSILIMGSKFLKENVVLKMEMLDNSGNPIYMEPVFDYSESGGIRVSIEVYDTVSPGVAELTILGELDPAKVDFEIPEVFRDVYNVKYTRTLTVNKEIPNDRAIKFFKRPKITVKEIVKGQITPSSTSTGSNVQTVGVLKGIPAPGSEGKRFEIDSPSFNEVPTYNDKNFGFSPIGNYDKQKSTKQSYMFEMDGAIFSSSMEGGTLTIANPQANPGFITSSKHKVVSYSSRITKVINSKTIEVQKPFGLYDSGSKRYQVSALDYSSYSINWPKPNEFDSSSVNFKSFADISVSNLRTFSGDIYRVAGYFKNSGPVANWQKVIDTPVESPELLLDQLSMTGTTRIGRFTSNATITSNWVATHGTFGNGSSITLGTSSPYEFLADSLYVSGSGIDMLADEPDKWIQLKMKPNLSMSFDANTEYTLQANLIADHRNESNTKQDIKAVFHLSGSAFAMSPNFGANGYGRAIGKREYKDATSQVYGSDNPLFETTFTPDNDGTAILQIRFTGGHWHVSDISIRPNTATNFSPEFIKVVAPLPPLQKRPDNLDFAFEFYDINNNKASEVITTLPDYPDGVEFAGENLNILGDDNSVGGSLFLGGDATGSGVQMGGVDSKLPETGKAGAQGSGFIRSVQYQGFTSASQAGSNTGFMIYSGSVLPDSGDSYAGVGLELVGESGSFRFGTSPSRFEVVADAFFVGKSNTQFISGSGGIIEISSSAFHLSSSGDVIISGSITATSGDIGGWKIIDNKLSGSNATLDAAGAAIYMSNKGPATNPTNGYYIDFTPSNSNPYYVRFGPDFAVSSSGKLIASGAVIEGVMTASAGFIANWVIGSNALHKETGGKTTGMSVDGDTRFFAGATSLTASGSAPFNVKSTGDITGSAVLFTGGKIGGFELASSYLRNTDNTVELSSTLPGLKIKDAGGVSRVEVKSGSLSSIGGGTQYVGNKSFEEQLGSLSAGRNFVGSINSWSFTEGGATNISLTDRNAYADSEKAVSGRVTLDVVVPAGSSNYSSNNTYNISQVVTASISAGDTLSFSSVGRFSSSFGGKGKDRALGPQYFRVEYLSASAWHPFLPAAQYTASNGYGEYFLGSGQYASFGASAEIPKAVTHLRLVLTGSINDDTGFSIEKPLFVGDKGEVNSELSGKTFTKHVTGSATAEYPETEITFDNFSLRSNTRKVEMTQEGLLIYNSEDSFLKMTGAGIEFRGGSGLASFGQSINRESFTNDSQIAGTLAAPSLQPYGSDPEDIGTSASDGNVAEFAKGNHRHRLTSGTLDTVLTSTNFSASVESRFGDITIVAGTGLTGGGSTGTITINAVGGSGITANANDLAVDSTVIRTTGNQTLGGTKTFSSEIQASSGIDVTGAITASGDISQSFASTGSFGHILVAGQPLQAASGTNTGDVTLAGSRNYITLGANQVITVGEVDISDDTNLAAGTGITLSGDTLTTNDSQIVHDNLSGFVANEHIDHSGVTITAGSGLTGGGTILASRTIDVGAGDGITVNSNDIAVNNTVIRTTGNQTLGGNKTFTGIIGIDNGSGQNHTIKNYGGDLTLESVGDDINLVGSWVRLRATDSGAVLSAFHGQGQLTLGGDGQTTYMLKVASGNSYMAGNLVIDGTVDGRDVAADGTKLDGIATSADNFNKVKIGGDNNVSGNDVTSGQTFTIAGGTSLSTAIVGRTATISVDNNGIGATQLAVSGDGSNTQFLRSDGDGTFTWAVPTDTNTTYSAGTALTLSGTTFSVTNDSIGDTQLAFNTGQHLTTSSTPTFAGLSSTGTINVGGGSIQKQGTHSLSLHSVKHISFDWDANYDSYEYHGISSRQGNGAFSDDLTIASFDDIHMRVDSNNNDGPAYMNMYNNSHNSTTYFGKWGYDGTNHILYHSGRVGIGNESPTHALDVSGTGRFTGVVTFADGSQTSPSIRFASEGDTGISRFGTDNVGFIANSVAVMSATAQGNYTVNLRNSAKLGWVSGTDLTGAQDTWLRRSAAGDIEVSGDISGSAVSTASFGRLDAHELVADGSGTPFVVKGTSGSLFSVSDNFSGSLMSVTDVSGIPIMEVFEDDRVVMGSFSDPAMTITGSFIGVGTSTPTRLIHLAAASPAIMWEDTDVSGLKHQIIGGGSAGLEYSADMNNTTTGYHRWDIGGSVAMKLIEGGSLRIGDGTNPSYKLDVNGTGRFVGAVSFNNNVHIASGYNLYLDGGSNTYIKENGADNMAFATAGAERVRITQGGNVGIGTTNPLAKFHVKHTTDDTDENGNIAMTVGGDSSGEVRHYWGVNNSGNYAYYGAVEHATQYVPLVLQPNGSNVGIGVTDPDSPLEIYHSTDSQIKLSINTHGDAGIMNGNADGLMIYGKGASNQVRFYSNTTEAMRVHTGGNVGIGNTSPGYKLTVGGRGYFWTTNQDAGWGMLTLDYGNGTNTSIKAIQMKEGGSVKAAYGYGSNGDLILYPNNSEAVRILANGYVGVGTNSATRQVHIYSSSGDKRGLMVENTVATSYAELQIKAQREYRIGTGGSSSDSNASNRFYIYDATSSAHRFTISDDGDIGIGDTTPSYKLDVNGTGRFTGQLNVDGNIYNAAQTLTTGTLRTSNGGSSSAAIISHASFTQTGIYWNDANSFGLTTGGTGTIYFASGKVAIGHTSPAIPGGLDIHASGIETAAVFGMADDGNAYIATRVGEVQNRVSGYIFQVGSAAVDGYGSANTTATITSTVVNNGGSLQGNLKFSTNAGDSLQTRMTILANGNIGINETSPGYKLHVNGTFRANSNASIGGDLTVSSLYVNNTNTRLQQGGGNALRVQTNSGYIDFGAMNGTYAHIYTDRGAFFLDSGIRGSIDIQLGGHGTETACMGYDGTYGKFYANSGKKLGLGAGGSATHVVVDTSGNVGIGTTSPGARLEVKGADGSNSTENTTLIDSNGNHLFTQLNGGKAYFKYGPVGIGDTSPDAPLDIEAANDPIMILNKTGGGNSAIHFQHAGNAKGYIYVDASQNMHFGNSSVNPTFEITAAGNVLVPTGYIQTNTVNAYSRLSGHSGGLEVQSSQTDYGGIYVSDTNGDFVLQLYGSSHARYGFLASEWGSWDWRKEIGGKIYTNNQTTYYLQPETTSNFNIITAAGNVTLTGQLYNSRADSTPAGTTFSNTIKAASGTGRTIYFDGDGSSVSTWYGVGNNPFGAIDLTDGVMQLWVNNSSGTWNKPLQLTPSSVMVYGALYFNDGNTKVEEGSNNSVRAQTNYGYIDIGPQNTGWGHIQTDRTQFYFNKAIWVDTGIVSSYDEDLLLKRAGTTGITIGSGTTTMNQDVVISNSESVGTSTYASGFTGEGWRIDQGITEANKTSAAFDNLVVRGTMSVYELQISQIRATNGNLFISSTGKADAVSESGGTYTITVDSGSSAGHGFAVNDIIRMQQFDNTGTGGNIVQSDLTVTGVTSTGSFTATLRSGTTAPQSGNEYVRLGNTSNADRQGGVYLTADDSNAPFIDVFDGVTAHTGTGGFNSAGTIKTRMGKLSGITSAAFGALSGYGLWASGSVYLEGSINATDGTIGGWNINAATLTGGSITLDKNGIIRSATNFSSGNGFYLDATTFRVGTAAGSRFQWDNTNVEIYNSSNAKLVSLGATNTIAGWDIAADAISKNHLKFDATNTKIIAGNSGNDASGANIRAVFGLYDGTNYGMRVWDGTNTYVRLSSSGNNEIAGWVINPNYLGKNNLRFDAANTKIIAGNSGVDTGTGTTRVIMGLFDSGYGIRIWDGTNTYARLHEDGNNQIAGWSINPTTLEKVTSTGGVRIDSSNKRMDFLSTATAVRLRVGQVDADKYGMRGFDGSGNRLFEISEVRNELAGWTISQDAITAPASAITIHATSKYIAIGTNGYQGANTIYLDGANSRFSVGANFYYSSNTLVAAGWTLNSASLTSPGSTITIHSTSKYIAIGTGGYKGADTIYLDGANSRMSVGPNFYYESSTLTVAGWTINSNTITSTNTILGLGYISLGSGTSAYNSANRIYIDGNNTRMSMGTGFRYTGNALTIDGNATIAGWTINSNSLTKNKVKLSAVNDASYFAIQDSFGYGNTGFWVGQTSSTATKLSLSGTAGKMLWDNTKLIVQGANGTTVFQTNATGAEIGGWTIGASQLQSSNASGGGDGSFTTAGIILHDTGYISAKEFNISSAGSATFKGAITGGTLSIGSGNTIMNVNSTGDLWIGHATETSAPFQVRNDGAVTATNAAITGDITANNITTVSGSIADWKLTKSGNSAQIITGSVGLNAMWPYNLTSSVSDTVPSASGLVVTDSSGIPILSVVSSSKGQTPITSLVAKSGTGTISPQWQNNNFSTGSTGNAPSTWQTSNTNWSNWVINASNSGSDSYGTDWGAIDPQACVIEYDQTIAANQTANTVVASSILSKDFDVVSGYTSLQMYIRAVRTSDKKYAQNYGDIALFSQTLKVQIFELTGVATGEVDTYIGGGSMAYTLGNQISEVKTFDVTNANNKLVKMAVKWKNTYSAVRVKITAEVTCKKTNRNEVKLGGWSVEGFKFSGIGGSKGVGARDQRAKPLVELSQEGLLVFSDENNFLRVNDEDGFTLKGDLDAQTLNVEGNTVMSGSITTLGELNIQGSLNLSDEQALPLGAFLSGSSDSRLHVFETVGTTTESFAAGITPSFRSVDGEHVIGIRSQVMPYQGTDYTGGSDTTKIQAAFGSIGIRPSYNFPNFAFYAETNHGTGDDASIGYTEHSSQTSTQGGGPMSSSIGIGRAQTFNTSKRSWGFENISAIGPSPANGFSMGDVNFIGAIVKHDTTAFELTTDGANGNHAQLGYGYICSGSYAVRPTIGSTKLLDSSAEDKAMDPDGLLNGGAYQMAAFGGVNKRTGTYGPSAGWGLVLDGDEWPSIIEGPLTLGSLTTNYTYALHVTGEIYATSNITAYSDIRNKTNIKKITNAIDIISDIRGVRFDWNDEYKEMHAHTPGGKQGNNDRRQIGVIAQEVEKVLPELVTQDETGHKGVDYQSMVAVLIEANKEQQKLIEDLQDRVKKLENK